MLNLTLASSDSETGEVITSGPYLYISFIYNDIRVAKVQDEDYRIGAYIPSTGRWTLDADDSEWTDLTISPAE